MPYVPPKYPGAIPTAEDLPDRTDDVDWMYAARYNELKKELRAALIELGTLPKGAHADVKTRLDTLGAGDIVGPASALDEAIARYNGTSGKLIQATLGAKIDDTGRLTNTAQPCFLVKPTSDQANIAIGSNITVVLDVEITDQGNNFASNTFTAPVNGNYPLNVFMRLNNVDTAGGNYRLAIITSNRTYHFYLDATKLSADPELWSMGMSVVADMDANDTAYVVIYQPGGTQQTDIEESATYFSGVLLC